MSLAERIRRTLDEQGLSQAELARRVGVTQQTIAKLASGQASGSKHLHRIARELHTTPAYLSGEIDDPAEDAVVLPHPSELAESLGLLKITEIDLNIGIGAAFMDEPEVTGIDRWIPQEWISNFTNTPAPLLAIARPSGDSMYPTIDDRDLVLIDRSQTRIDRADAIWLLVFGGFSTIKRVRMQPDGTARLMADNPQVRDETATDVELSIIGRIAGVFRRA